MPTPTEPAAAGTPEIVDLAVVGAGPAGLAATAAAAGLGLSCALLDAGALPGGQFYRQPAPGLRASRPQALHHGWRAFADLVARLEAHRADGSVRHYAGYHVWSVSGAADAWELHAVSSEDGRPSRTVRARAVLCATGSHERQLPFPGWTLPGVVGAGGAQAMLKSGLVLPGRRVVVAGSGPLLLAVAASLADAGARVPLLVEATGYAGYARHPWTVAANPGKLAEGAAHAARLLRRGVAVRTRSAVVAAHGQDRIESVTVARIDRDWRPVPGTGRRIACDALAVGHGLLPQLELALELGCGIRALPDGSPALLVDAEQRTTVEGLWAAGETTGVGGAELAMIEGELAASSIAATLRRPAPAPASADSAGRVRTLVRRRNRLRRFAELMADRHRPGAGWADWLTSDTEVCRCEEVTVGAVREAVDELGAGDPRTVKLLTRAGMGWCQGRMCGPAVARLTGGDDPAGTRPLSCPVPMGVLAAVDDPTQPGARGPHAPLCR
ncbi:FAD-dependent oxidoreductase [Streptacidiphilus sp. PB12-B1b]|uniref:FAD/NAD(P)-dependent oxidoreductase n=1 Tax=Streptacidiphilus sp. PB12-B1b TaxID=2705012 RepID=UPI0015F7C156|nr:NAD(P)/FAD-dependent oxidoreductase [Streptacidiphilus sp. PB12-B1b]QMU77292.1 FAD-dependent oxidoreductase [Streptacidiphilus sp. PB12-B1b]